MHSGSPVANKHVDFTNDGTSITVTKSAYGIQYKGQFEKFAFFEVSVSGKIKKTTAKKMVPCDGDQK